MGNIVFILAYTADHRLELPVKQLGKLSTSTVMLTIYPYDNGLYLTGIEKWRWLEQEFSKLPRGTTGAYRINRVFLGHAEMLELIDSSILIPEELRSYIEPSANPKLKATEHGYIIFSDRRSKQAQRSHWRLKK